jgi:hypothetical protein
MCDYSLHCIKTRLATEGEQLFIHKFYTGSKGLAAVADLRRLENRQPAPAGTSVWGRFRHWFSNKIKDLNNDAQRELPAVCIPPGARLHLSDIPKHLQTRYEVGASEEVVFAQLSLEPFRHRDAVRFGNGQEVLLQYLNDGLQARVISLAASEEEEELPTFAMQVYQREELYVAA